MIVFLCIMFLAEGAEHTSQLATFNISPNQAKNMGACQDVAEILTRDSKREGMGQIRYFCAKGGRS